MNLHQIKDSLLLFPNTFMTIKAANYVYPAVITNLLYSLLTAQWAFNRSMALLVVKLSITIMNEEERVRVPPFHFSHSLFSPTP